MSTENIIYDILAAPVDLEREKTGIVGRAEKVLDSMFEGRPGEMIRFESLASTERQVRYFFRPFLACLATRCSEETGLDRNTYEDDLVFERDGKVVTGHFKNYHHTTWIELTLQPATVGNVPVASTKPAADRVPELASV
jgi:hypothetical protein